MARRKGANPKPRIGRKDKKFIPSKKLQRKYKKVKKIYEGLKEKEDLGTGLTIEEAFARGIVGSKVKKRPVYTSIIDKLAIMTNIYGIENVSELLNVRLDLLEFALQGNILTRQQQAILERGYNDLQIEETEIDFDEIEKYAESLQFALDSINEEKYVGSRYKDNFRWAVAADEVNIEENLDRYEDIIGHTLFAQGLDASHRAKINSFIEEINAGGKDYNIGRGNNLDLMFQAYRDAMNTDGTIWFPKQPDSSSDEIKDWYYNNYWWAWFRETFYE